ncbi:toll-like receptor 4 [Mytilus edulis]|uniref:toll-like receptor 4 n=1 Tax=Mytilus edulis TaxID=6550 RepID=UPI0039F019A5
MKQVLFFKTLLILSVFSGYCYKNNIVQEKTGGNFFCQQFYQHNELHVDCSYKNLTVVPDIPADTVYLYLQHNIIGQIPNKTFEHLNKLDLLDLSFNTLNIDNEDAFAGQQNLRFLYLKNGLQYYNYTIIRLPKNVFKHLFNLTVLDLSANIMYVDEYTFSGLMNLQHLKLDSNWLRKIPNDTFQYTPKLLILDLSSNFLNNVSKGMFNGLGNLHHLYLNNNWIETIENNAFQSLINLTVLDLAFNFFIHSINKQTFAGLPKLRHLNLHFNNINNISNHTFENLTDLRVLDLSNNKLQSVNGKTFIGLKNLDILRLNSNSLRYNTDRLPQGCFQPLESLKQLSIQMNNPQGVVDAFVLPDETIKDLNMLETLELDVNADNEDILGIGFSSLTNLSSLTFSGVCKFPLYNDTFRYTPNLTHFRSIHCDMKFIETGAFLSLTKLIFVELDFVCTLTFKHFSAMEIVLPLSKTTIEILRMNNVYLEYSWWENVNTLLLATSIRELHITNNDNCVDRRVSIPLKRFIPAPVSLQRLDLSNNNIDQISLNLTYVKFLNLSGNLLGHFLEEYSYALNEPRILEFVCLSNNSIKHIFSKLFVRQPKLQNIDLSFNKLADVSFDLSQLVDLEILNLSSNTIRYLDDWSMQNIGRLLEISRSLRVDFSNNKFLCNCYSIRFLNWTLRSRNRFVNFDTYKCTFHNGSSLELKSLRKGILIDLQRDCLNYSISIIITCSAMFVFIAILLMITFYRHRQKVRFMFYTLRGRLHFLYYKTKLKNRFRSTNPSENNLDYIYDAFVSYSDEDRAFVLNECIENLENDGNLKLCLHHRDFVPGHDITDNIIHAIESSRKTICIITRSFLQSYYCMFEFNMARMESIHSRNGKNVLFLVFYEQFLPEELPLVLYEVIQKQTYIEFPNDEHGNRIFWEKIKDGIFA